MSVNILAVSIKTCCIKNSIKKEENRRFSTLIKNKTPLITKEVLCFFYTIPLVFYWLCLKATAHLQIYPH